MISFADLTKQVHLINDLILSDMICDSDDTAEETVSFSKHLLATKYWFARISYTNKKRYLLALLQDVRSAWALSLLLKSLWNCRPKDAVMSVSEAGGCLSSYDQVPMDHNRTALPVGTLAQVMKNDRIWFLSLNPEFQALVLSELLTVAGGPAMWEVLSRARTLYDRYHDQMLLNLQECTVVQDSPGRPPDKGVKKEQSAHAPAAEHVDTHTPRTQAQKDLEANLATWNATIKSLRDSLKLEEYEMTFNDGTKTKAWKVNRPKPDILETVDFVQLLPSAVGKKILSFLPRAQLGDYARVNKYWAYLVDEYRAELAARVKISADFDRLNEILIKHDESLDEFVTNNELPILQTSEQGIVSLGQLGTPARTAAAPSVRASEKSGGAYSLRFFSEKLTRPLIVQKPIRNMAELNERLERRGAADENIWQWCENLLTHAMKMKKRDKKAIKSEEQVQKKKEDEEEGVLSLGNVHFPCPLMKLSLSVPLKPPLYKDPARTHSMAKPRKNISDATVIRVPEGQHNVKRYSLWTRDLSSLYPVFKIPSYQFPPV